MTLHAVRRAAPPLAAHEHEFEAAHGLPEPLPAGERMLWQGAPDWHALAVQALHLRAAAIYFALLLLWQMAGTAADGAGIARTLLAALPLALLALFALGTLALIAWLMGRSTVYTITDRRVVMRIGIVLTVTFNLPYRSIQNADLRLDPRGGTGDIALALKSPDRIAYLHLWPHARPWRIARPEPMLRGVPDAAAVARILSGAWSQATGIAPQAVNAAPPRTAGDARPPVLAH